MEEFQVGGWEENEGEYGCIGWLQLRWEPV